MAHATAVLNVVGLNRQMLEHAPRLQQFAKGSPLRQLVPDLPAVTCTVQASMLTGLPVREHGIVANGWYDRELCEVHFWKQSNKLVQGEKVWETARKRDPSVTVLNMFWWFNMYSSADYSVTPRPIYKADGRKIPDCYANPPELRDELQKQLGTFPLFSFWGPGSSIESSRWIAKGTVIAHERLNPTLTLVYLPHLDYALQQVGPEHPSIPEAVREIDNVAGDLIDQLESRGVRVIVLSEYGIERVNEAIFINRMLREQGDLRVRFEQGLELLDPGASPAFAVTDHQLAHVYVKDPQDVSRIELLCRTLPGVDKVLNRHAQRELGIDHPRAGELVLIAGTGRWFTYDYWLDHRRAPDFARTVDIHRKPGYDPRELFLDPHIPLVKLKLAWRLFQRKVLGQRALLDVIPLDTALVRGSHGRTEQPAEVAPLIVSKHMDRGLPEVVPCRGVRDIILQHLFDVPAAPRGALWSKATRQST